jgi:hypothetical protein
LTGADRLKKNIKLQLEPASVSSFARRKRIAAQSCCDERLVIVTSDIVIIDRSFDPCGICASRRDNLQQPAYSQL